MITLSYDKKCLVSGPIQILYFGEDIDTFIDIVLTCEMYYRENVSGVSSVDNGIIKADIVIGDNGFYVIKHYSPGESVVVFHNADASECCKSIINSYNKIVSSPNADLLC